MKILPLLAVAGVSAVYQDTCPKSTGTVNCQVYCKYCENPSILAALDSQLIPELNCHVEGQKEKCACNKMQKCTNLLKTGSWKSSMKPSDAITGRTVVIIDESASINLLKKEASISDQHNTSLLIKQFIIENYNKWLDQNKPKQANGPEYLHDKVSTLLFNEVFELYHTNTKETAKRLDHVCNYYPEKSTKFGDAITCAAHMYMNECNVKFIMFSDGEENASNIFKDKAELEILKDLKKKQGWEFFYASTRNRINDAPLARFQMMPIGRLEEKENVLTEADLHNTFPALIDEYHYFSIIRNSTSIEKWLQMNNVQYVMDLPENKGKTHQEIKEIIANNKYYSFFSTELWSDFSIWKESGIRDVLSFFN